MDGDQYFKKKKKFTPKSPYVMIKFWWIDEKWC
jgi:hypothetical protein